MADFDLSGLAPEDKDLIISRLAPSLMGKSDSGGDEHSACADIFEKHQAAILLLSQALDEISEKLGITDKFSKVIEVITDAANEKIKEQEMQEMEDKLGSIYSPYVDKYSALSQGGNLKDLLYDSIKELQKRPDYTEDMFSAFVKDKMGEFQKVLDALNAPSGKAEKPEGGAVSVEKTTVAPKAEEGMKTVVPETKETAPEATPEVPDAFGLTPSKLKELEERANKARAMAKEKGKKKTS